MITKVEGDYLKLLLKENQLISLKKMSVEMNVSITTIKATIKRMEKKNLVKYVEYKGVELTLKGRKEAQNLINIHRLWEYFLVNKLHIKQTDVHKEAEILEHVTSKEVLEHLYIYLDKPKYCPHGQEINLSILKEKKIKKFIELKKGDEAFLIKTKEIEDYLNDLYIKNNLEFMVIKIMKDESYLIEMDNNRILMPKYLIEKAEVIVYE